MDRRRFLASAAATAIAPSCLAKPAAEFLTETTWTIPVYYEGCIASDNLGQLYQVVQSELYAITAIPAHMQGPRP